jgi:hypothetical protein
MAIVQQLPNPKASGLHTDLARDAARLGGFPADGFVALCMPDGTVCVRSPGCVAFYVPDQWLELFTGHLRAGYFLV